MDVSWGPVPDGFVHGILRGYRIYFTKTQEMGRPTSSQTQVITLRPNVYNTTIKLLNNFAIYDLSITAFTIKGEGAMSAIEEGGKFCFSAELGHTDVLDTVRKSSLCPGLYDIRGQFRTVLTFPGGTQREIFKLNTYNFIFCFQIYVS